MIKKLYAHQFGLGKRTQDLKKDWEKIYKKALIYCSVLTLGPINRVCLGIFFDIPAMPSLTLVLPSAMLYLLFSIFT